MLLDGLYEQIISKSLDSELASSDKLSQTAPIDTAEASKVLAKYVAEVVERGLENLKDNGGNLSFAYKLDVNSNHFSANRMDITVKKNGSGNYEN